MIPNLLRGLYSYYVNKFPAALCDRLLDHDENVRKQVVSVVCDVACHVLTSVPVETIKLVSERLRDKSVCVPSCFCISFSLFILVIYFACDLITFDINMQLLVKRYTMERLADVYRISCMERCSGSLKNGDYDWILGKILRCFNDKDFR